jgi:glyoxylase-like metal-dependent hydrolase (beta-lactamase superfamily II)
MRKLLKVLGIIAGAVLLVVLGIVGLFAASFAGTAQIRDGFEPVSGVRTIKEKFTSIYMVDSRPGRVVLVDAGMDGSAALIMQELDRRGLKAEAVEAILLTHGHSDHVGGVLAFPRADVYALDAEVPVVEGTAGTASPMGRLAGAKPTGIKVNKVLKDGQSFKVGNLSVKVFTVPGHTQGSAVYLARGVLFMGDSADSLKKGGISGAKWMFSESQKQNHAALKALASRLKPSAVRAMVFAHSGAIIGFQPLADFAAAN